IFYFESAGLDAHTDAWTKSAAYKMLTETPLGEMLEAVGTQLLDKAISYVPDARLGSKDVIALMKHAAHHGFAIGVHDKGSKLEKGEDPYSTTVVFRGAAGKEARGLWSRLMGSAMAGQAPQLEKKEGRTLVVIARPPPLPAGYKRCWWAEKDDLVLSIYSPHGTAGTMAALDGKVPSATEHPIVKELSAKEGEFEPVGIAFLELEHIPPV